MNLFGSDDKTIVWRTPNPQCIVSTVTHGGGSVTVWSCFTEKAVGELYILNRTIDRFYYRGILERNLLSSMKKFNLGKDFFLVHDNVPNHTSTLVNEWPKENSIPTLSWPSSSSNVNPMEHLWDELERRLKKHQPKNIRQLQVLLQEE